LQFQLFIVISLGPLIKSWGVNGVDGKKENALPLIIFQLSPTMARIALALLMFRRLTQYFHQGNLILRSRMHWAMSTLLIVIPKERIPSASPLRLSTKIFAITPDVTFQLSQKPCLLIYRGQSSPITFRLSCRCIRLVLVQRRRVSLPSYQAHLWPHSTALLFLTSLQAA